VYLTCPQCSTVYAVRAAMLKEGQGEVRCGACNSVFNALDCLTDDLPAGREPARDARADAAPPAPPVHPGAISDDPIPAGIRADLASLDDEISPATRNLGLWLAALLMLLGLAAQYLWFAPEDLGARFPMLRATVQEFCLKAGCMIAKRRAPEQIRILSRDVRAHPRYEGALLVTATFSSSAPWPQPFPVLRFSLYDVNGQTIAARSFRPAQYLQGVLPADAVLPPGQPVQVALEMLAPEEAAVSFEFGFL
jgi:predicted Zn finger-like uncharacterized protein